MDDHSEHSAKPAQGLSQTREVVTRIRDRARFFQLTDWLCFALTTALTLAVYLVTLAPDVTLGDSGIFSVGAMYAGVPHPPGYPLWTLYAHLFTRLPVSNIAWRVAVSSAVSGALACGLIALLVSRGGALIVEEIPGTHRLKPHEARALRVACGCVAGMGFGFDGGFWRTAVVASSWPLSLLLFSSVLCLLMRWMYAPNQRRYLYAASFVYGLTFTNSQILLAAAPGLQVAVMLGERRLVREICLANSLLFVGGLSVKRAGCPDPFYTSNEGFNLLGDLYYLAGIGSMATCVVLWIRTRRILTEWRPVLVSGFLFVLGLTPYLYPPIASMTNPPVNWAYPRTAEGFIHLLTRGQYERIQATARIGPFAHQLRMCAETAATDFGLLYLLAALVPFCLLRKIGARERRWILGLLAVYVCLAFLLLVVLNPGSDRNSREFCEVFFSASHIVLAVWSGYGLMLLGVLFTRRAV